MTCLYLKSNQYLFAFTISVASDYFKKILKVCSQICFFMALFLAVGGCRNQNERGKDGTYAQRDEWMTFFHKNEYEFNQLREYIHEAYVASEVHEEQLRVVLLNCRIDQKILPVEICDERAIEIMADLGIHEAAIEREVGCKDVKGLNTIYFTMAEHKNPAVLYIYDYCPTTYASEMNKLEYWPLNGYWALQFEY